MNLLDSTKKLLKSRLEAGMTLREIANESKGEVQFEWLRKFADGTAENPTVTRVQGLHDFLIKLNSRPKSKSAA